MRAKQRGAATIEAICALFVFIPIWAGVMHLGELYSTQLQSESEARRCAWLISAGACSGDVEGCESFVGGGSAGKMDKELNRAAQRPKKSGKLGEMMSEALEGMTEDLFGKRAEARSGHSVTAPELLGGEAVEIGATYSLPCNTKPREADNIAKLGFELLTE